MKKVILVAVFALMTFGWLANSSAVEGDLPGGVRSLLNEALGTKDGGAAEERAWLKTMRAKMDEENQKIDIATNRGELSKREARRFKDDLNDLSDKIDRMKKEGQISQRERESVEDDLDKLDQRIFREKREEKKRY
jgi:hypothetical protein